MKEYTIYGWQVMINYDRQQRLWLATADKEGHDQKVVWHVDRDIALILLGAELRG